MRPKSKRAQSIVELCVGLAVLVPIVLVVFDLAVIVMAVQVNDSTCREAARVAAGGDLGDLAQGKSIVGKTSDVYKRAQAVVTRANSQAAGMLTNFKLEEVRTEPAEGLLQATIQQLGATGGPVAGTVFVSVTVEVRPFIVKYAYSGGQPIVFRSTQAFPFTYVVPNTSIPIP